jgi:carbon monoxide dehydrogenase subunit G
VLSDVERIAPLLPGAQLQEVEGDDYRGIVKVKVGPITAQYKGTATFIELDETAGRMVLKATGRDTRGQGNASAMVTVTMSPDGDGTKVNVSTDLTITGKVAQFGRGVLADVSGKLIGQFVDALEADLEAGGTGTVATAEAIVDAAAGDVAAEETATDGAVVSGDAAGATPGDEAAADEAAAPLIDAEDTPSVTPLADTVTVSAPSAGPRKIHSPEPEPVDLLDAAGGTVAKRLLPLLGGAAAVVVLVVALRRRSRRTKLSSLRAALPDRGDVPSIDQLRRHLPDLPDLPAAQELGRRAAKRAKKAARRR